MLTTDEIAQYWVSNPKYF